jgi:glucose-6-phosphate 1-epimerase
VDKLTTPISTNTAPSSTLSISSKIDRVYTPAGGPSKPVVIAEGGKPKFSITRDNLNEVVVWNPWTDGANMPDFGPADGHKNMVCVEAGAVKGWQKLEAGETWEGGQIITDVV